MLSKDNLLTIRQAADLLGVSLMTMRKISNAEDFPIIRLSPRRQVIIRADFEKWLQHKSDLSVGGGI